MCIYIYIYIARNFAASSGHTPTGSPFRRALAMQSSGINCSPAPDLVLLELILLRVFLSGGVSLFTDTGMNHTLRTRTYVYVYIYIYIYVYACIMCVYIYIYIYMHLSLSLYIYIYIYIKSQRQERVAAEPRVLSYDVSRVSQ